MEKFDITEKVAVITGAASGIGFNTAKELLKNGIKGVTIVDVNDDAGAEALKSLAEYGSRVIFVKADITNKAQFEEAFKRTVDVFGNVDILINNASILNDALWEKQVDINIKGTINGTVLAMEHYIKDHKSGSEGLIINIASISIFDVEVMVPFYTATKYAILGLTRAFGNEAHYDRTNVKVVTVCPGATSTPLKDENIVDRIYSMQYLQMNMSANTTEASQVSQPPEHVGESIAKIIKDCPNGSIWIVEQSKSPYQVVIPSKERCRKELECLTLN
ncbi:15-hydroxyprostaglandin dehydrogenase [NAD(+)]-like [Photinus pyralis]|nr:15-hydroxyprostaglandin dehydrogenase [NAD(+)]-like [Photinus pyralis]